MQFNMDNVQKKQEQNKTKILFIESIKSIQMKST